jgi:hypothetical protein
VHVGHAKCTLSFRCSMPTMLAHMFAKVWVFMREYSLLLPSRFSIVVDLPGL